MAYDDVLSIILGGGAGTRLWPLTKERSKPAVPIGGRYRLVDIPISNCLNSGLNRIHILTQFNSVSLHRHIQQTYRFDLFSAGWVEILAAERTPTSSDWYQGTADAVRKQLPELRAVAPRDFLVLAGDHLYRMDYSAFIEAHRDSGADITVAVLPVSRSDAPRFGILETDPDLRIVNFAEKPKAEEALDRLATYPDPERPYLGSMGVYLFRAEVLYRLLEETDDSDFGNHVLPQAIGVHRVMAYPFDDYWEDIGTIRAFYEANLALTEPDPAFRFHDTAGPIYTHPRFLPPSQIEGCAIDRALLADGCQLAGASIREVVIGVRSRIGAGTRLDRVVMMGADHYEEAADLTRNRALDRPDIGIGRGCSIEGAIIDKNARIGDEVTIRHDPTRPDSESESWVAREGLVIVPKNGVIPSGTVI